MEYEVLIFDRPFKHQTTSLRVSWENIQENTHDFLLKHASKTAEIVKSFTRWEKSFFLYLFSIIWGTGCFSSIQHHFKDISSVKVLMNILGYLGLFADTNYLVQSGHALLQWFCLFFFFFNVSFYFDFNSVCIDSIQEKQMSWERFR